MPDFDLDLDHLQGLADAAVPGVWKACGDARGGCSCGTVWSVLHDAPIATVTVGDWGDDVAAIRTNEAGEAEAYIMKDVNGSVSVKAGTANAAFIAGLGPEVAKKLIAMAREGVAARAAAGSATVGTLP